MICCLCPPLIGVLSVELMLVCVFVGVLNIRVICKSRASCARARRGSCALCRAALCRARVCGCHLSPHARGETTPDGSRRTGTRRPTRSVSLRLPPVESARAVRVALSANLISVLEHILYALRATNQHLHMGLAASCPVSLPLPLVAVAPAKGPWPVAPSGPQRPMAQRDHCPVA